MVNWSNCVGSRWFGFRPGSPYEGDCYSRAQSESQTTNPNQQLTIVWLKWMTNTDNIIPNKLNKSSSQTLHANLPAQFQTAATCGNPCQIATRFCLGLTGAYAWNGLDRQISRIIERSSRNIMALVCNIDIDVNINVYIKNMQIYSCSLDVSLSKTMPKWPKHIKTAAKLSCFGQMSSYESNFVCSMFMIEQVEVQNLRSTYIL